MDKLRMHTIDGVEGNVERIAALFPNCVTEAVDNQGNLRHVVDFDKLKVELGEVVEGPEERYQFTWPGKRDAIRLANSPIAATLRPVREDSVDFDNTQNLYIEGDNLDVLKLLRETYLGKVKMIYIDPPYNTGNDFVYEDDFSQATGDYLANSGQYDDQGNRLVANTESNGRFHTDWLNMIYPRLKVARDLLTEDGVIFISIDDNEVENLKKICDEVFGAANYVNTISANMKKIAGASGGGEDKRLKKNCEFILLYTKNYQALNPFAGVYSYTEMHEVVEEYRKEGKNWHYTSVLVDPGEKLYIGSTVDGDGNEIKIYRRPNAVIKSVKQVGDDEGLTEKEVYYKYGTHIFEAKDAQSSIRSRVIAAKKEYGINDDVVSIEYVPKTGKNKGQMYEQFYKGVKCRLFAWLRDISEVIDGVLYKKDAQGTYWDLTSYINNLSKEGDVVFPNGKKPIALIDRMITMQTDSDSIIMDFFSGSASTAHAVIQSNANDRGKRTFIMVQYPEKCDPNTGFKNVCEIGKERIRRAGKKIKADAGLMGQDLDIGFRVLRLDSSNMEDVYYTPDQFDPSAIQGFIDNVKADRSEEDLLFQVMLELDIPLSASIQQEQIAGKRVFNVADGHLIATFDRDINETTVTEVARRKPNFFVMRDASAANDNVLDNFDQIFHHYSPDTTCKIL